MKLSVVVPCYNEEKNIPIILEKFAKIITSDDIELILVNNGSTDNSTEILNQLLPDFSFARVVTVTSNQGYGFGITSGLKVAQGKYIGYTHADMQTAPEDILKALEIIESQANPLNCYVKGNRKGRPLFDQLFTWGMSGFESLYLGVKLWDINAQPNIFPKYFLEQLENIPKDFSMDLYLLYTAKKQGMKIIRFDVLFPERIHGQSSWNTGLYAKWKFIKRTINFSFKLNKNI